MPSPDESWTITPSTERDREAWGRLHTAYGASAGDRLDETHLTKVWSWITRPDGQTRCLLLWRDGEPVGLAHYRLFERPLAGSTGCYLDDLFVEVRLRGRGGARALLRHLSEVAVAEDWSTVRWTTGVTNLARRLYDSLADRGPVITYDMLPKPRS